MKNILITGAAGELGILLCNEFINREMDVYGIDHAERDGHIGLDLIGRNAFFHFYNQSIEEVDWEEFEHIDSIFHLAQTFPETNELSELKSVIQQHQRNMKKVAQFAAEQNSRIILVSTMDVYGNEDEPTQADRSPKPANLYGTLMLTEETFLSEAAEHHEVIYHIMRIPNVSGCSNPIMEGCYTIDKLEKAGEMDHNREISNNFTITKERFIMSCNQLLKGSQSEKITTFYGKT
ncbi:NAD-dependent epimerase/dehydratase family protein [Pseudalkalibacillus salsuginis]|uniref:NAD-dependent epimerase/dehydratase family protein n=1 Tax=Pseudalkalibacillus salsuginis TaxID=2910972 RepID=UPI001F178474|nr:NAD(P)-dependent oxidoreductase [Pseudalkalibacillus salsuginis]MCF6409215.1 NAD(P)-dependent oxidoreductase [Pseudalkalibacillus salsuginis]